MTNRLKNLYLDIGRVLNNPQAFGLEERMPKLLSEMLTKVQLELLEEMRDQGVEQDFLSQELSQDADRHALYEFTSTSFEVPKTGT